MVTLVSPGGEYGGPTRVAVNQLAALQANGHDVVLAGAHRGFDGRPPHSLDDVPMQLFPARTVVPGIGFAGLSAPGLLRAVWRHAQEFDVVHVHAARDLITLPAARLAQMRGVRTVLQTHGMIDESSALLARPLDAMLTRPALRNAHVVTHLTPAERRSLVVIGGGGVAVEGLPNGVPLAEETLDAAPQSAHVLFLARLAPRKRPRLFVEAASSLADEFPTARFTLVGPDEGEGAAVSRAIAESGASDRIAWTGPTAPDRTLQAMRRASVYALPSVDEPYPMSVLEAMSVGRPVVITESCGLAEFVRDHEAGIVITEEPSALAAALRTLLVDPARAAAMGRRGRDAVRTERSMGAIADRLEELYA